MLFEIHKACNVSHLPANGIFGDASGREVGGNRKTLHYKNQLKTLQTKKCTPADCDLEL